MKGGRGRIRAWATREAALVRVLGAYMLRLNLRTSASRHPKVVVLKQIIGLKQAVAGVPVEQAALAGPVSAADEDPGLLVEIPPVDSQQARDDEAMEEEEAAAAAATMEEHGCHEVPTGSISTEPANQDHVPTTAGSIGAEPANQDHVPTTAGSIGAEPENQDQVPTTAGSIPTEPGSQDQVATTTGSIGAESTNQDQVPTTTGSSSPSTTAAAALTTQSKTDEARIVIGASCEKCIYNELPP